MDGQQPAGQPGSSPQQNQPQEMKERVISEKVVSERVIGSSSGMARFGRKVKSQISSRLGGVGFGLLLILISFFVVWYSEKFDKAAALVADLPVLSVEQAASQEGMVKVQGNVTSAPIKASLVDKEVIYYHHVREELEMVTETETKTQIITRDGQDIEQTIEREVERPKWVTKINESRWVDFVLGNKITVKPSGAKQLLNYNKIYSVEEEKVREIVTALLPEDALIVVGMISNNEISSGKPFIITNKTNAVLVESLESLEGTTWWILKFATLLLFGLGLYSLLGPLLLVLDAIPILGNIGKKGLLLVCLAVGLFFTIVSSLVIAYWYVILILLASLVVYLIYMKKQQMAKIN